MPRPRKNIVSASDRIAALNEDIEKLTAKIKEKKEILKNLMKEKEDEDLKKVIAAVKSSGLSYEEILKRLAPEPNEEELKEEEPQEERSEESAAE